jgi:predicted esterase
MRDPDPEVKSWAVEYLQELVFRDFSSDPASYSAWFEANRNRPLSAVITDEVRRVVAEAAASRGPEAERIAQLLAAGCNTWRKVDEARKEALAAGLLEVLQRWAADESAEAPPVGRGLREQAVNNIGCLQLDASDLARVVTPLIAPRNPVEVRAAAIRTLGDPQHAWAVGLLLDTLKDSLTGSEKDFRMLMFDIGSALGEIGDVSSIPVIIGAIEADDTYDTVYGLGYFGLWRLTGVEYHETHTGAWWRRWWQQNKDKYPLIQFVEIPKLDKKLIPSDPLADVADVPSLDLHVGEDQYKRYFLVGGNSANPPAEGHSLLIVLPGGDGGADFNPFVRRIHKNVLNERWLAVQLVAPKWDEKQFESLVWPTAANRHHAVRFTTEEFIQTVVDDVRARVQIDPRRVFLLGWSSAGPACYATVLSKPSPASGALIAMSVFKPEQLPALENAKGKHFYLLQSPDDQVTRLRFAEDAESALSIAGAKVHLHRYEGGHGWHGDMWGMLRAGIEWLETEARESKE